MSEAESKVAAVREVYTSYYREMGGLGTAPDLEAAAASATKGAARSPTPRMTPPARLAAPDRPAGRKSVPALLIFAAMVALIVAYTFLKN
ncbi:hypothetical protein CI41S_61720 [Bradyrhizobium ivorense]|nr:hypothetical protein CI41S_61720 [Bradyrhizobium ivorense]